MGLLTDVFVADPADAVAYPESSASTPGSPSEGSRKRYEVRSLDGLSHLEFERLWAILEGEPWSPERHALEALMEDEDSWLFRFPSRFVARLAALPEAQLNLFAARWAKIEELDCGPGEVSAGLQAVRALALSATSSGRGLFLWGSL